uniref:Toll-like receptor n=1 Tax=Actinia tenebrosa TaxID=6105 RepID=A0A1D6XRJ6_ACTTE|nr:Toll-like receptor [Actinia tenebrosa]
MFKYVDFRCLAIVLTVIRLLSLGAFAEECQKSIKAMPWPSIYENVEFFPFGVVFIDGGSNCELDFGPYLNQTKKDVMSTFYLNIVCAKPTQVKIKNPSNVQRKNVISYIIVRKACEIDLEGLAVFSNATDYRVLAMLEGAFMKTPNSSQEVQQLQSQINKIGTLTIQGGSKGLPEIFVKYNWSLMAEIQFFKLSIQSLPKTLKFSMPRLQGLELSHNELVEPPDFPWDDEELPLPGNLSRKAVFNEQYQGTTEVKPNLYRRFLTLDFNKIQNLSRFEFRGHLQRLSIKGNGLKAIGENCLVHLTGINAIDLSVNKLDALPKGIFRGLKDLFHLRLNNNNITVIHVETFADSKRMKKLYLNNNNIERISKGLLLQHEDLEELHLQNNLIVKVEHGALPNNSNKLKNLNLNGNQLQTIPSDVFLTRSLESANLANNVITFEGIIETLHSIIIERLLNVLRKSVSDMSREIRTDSVYIDLTNNNIKAMDTNELTKEQMVKLGMVLQVFEMNFKNNPILCDCRALNITRIIKGIISKYSHINERRFQSWVCAAPPQLKGKRIVSIAEENFVCVRNLSGCPVEGTCSVRQTDGSIIIDARDKNLKQLPHMLPVGTNLEIFLDNNQITELSMRGYLGNVSVLHLSRNKIQQINDSFIESLTKVRQLSIDRNELKRLPRSIESLTSRKTFVSLALHSNYLECDCRSKWMKGWLMNSSDKINDIENVKCASGMSQGRPIYRVPLKDFICEEKKVETKFNPRGNNDLLVIVSVTLGVLLVIITAVFMMVYFFRGEMKVFIYTHFDWHPFDRIDDSDPSKIYDAFISYSSHDQEWVHNELKQKLEGHEPPYKICFHDRDFEVGASIQDNIINSVNRSKRMIMVLSNRFLESEWCRLEFRAAHHKVLQDKTNYLIVILFEGIDTNALDDETRLYLRTNTYLSVTNKWFWQKLLYSLPKPQGTVKENQSLGVQGSSRQMSIEIKEYDTASSGNEKRKEGMEESKM